MKHKFVSTVFLLISALLLPSCTVFGPSPYIAPPRISQEFTQDNFQARVDSTRQELDLIGIGAVVADADGNILALAVSGERVRESNDPVQPGDAWHIGSNTKMLTALLYARLVERGEAHWGATLSELLPDLAEEMDPAWREVTVEELMSHRSGLPRDPVTPSLGPFSFNNPYIVDEESPYKQRTSIVRNALAKPSRGVRGLVVYSNLGYLILGAAIDRIASTQPGAGEDASYETLFREVLFENAPESAQEGWGFGPPSVGIEGHYSSLMFGYKPVGKGPNADNPPPLAPAGTAHAPLTSHAIILSQFLTPDSVHSKLLAPYPDESRNYAFGWGVYNHDDYGMTYGHNGSNNLWFSIVWLLPKLGVVIIVNTNQSSVAINGAINSLAETIAGDIAKQQMTDLISSDTGGLLVEPQNLGYTVNEALFD